MSEPTQYFRIMGAFATEGRPEQEKTWQGGNPIICRSHGRTPDEAVANLKAYLAHRNEERLQDTVTRNGSPMPLEQVARSASRFKLFANGIFCLREVVDVISVGAQPSMAYMIDVPPSFCAADFPAEQELVQAA